jgi:hypothetical protein
MLKIITSLTLFLIGMLAKGQEVETRTVSTFSKVKVQHGIELVYLESKTPSVRIEAENKTIMKNISTKVSGSTLYIDLVNSKVNLPLNSEIKVYVSTTNLQGLQASSKAKITILEELNTNNMTVVLDSGATFNGIIKSKGTIQLETKKESEFKGKIEAFTLNGVFKNNSKIILTGKSQKSSFETSDTVLFNAKNFIATSIIINANGLSSSMIHANSNLAVNVADEAKVTYTGFPDQIELNEEATSFQKYNNNQSLTYNYVR